jgi:sulfite exporter TauE/SafE
MELLGTALILGLVGSVHCAAMCGPLLLAVANMARPTHSRFSVCAYHAGRLTTYCALGVLFGMIGKTFALVGLQRWLSIAAGGVILFGLAVSTRSIATRTIGRAVGKIKVAFGRLLQRRTLAAQFFLGTLNGLLPCGLVYIAAAGAAATLSPWVGAAHMATFGLGTLPMLLGIGIAGRRLNALFRFPRLVPLSVTAVALLLLLRGMALGIPYVSPALNMGAACH